MGVYDSVEVKCPQCGDSEYFQSKGSDDAACRVFTLSNCPDDVLSNVNRHSPHHCANCGCCFAVDEASRTPVKAKEFDWTDEGINSWYVRDEEERLAVAPS